MEEIKEIIMSHCQGVARPEFELEDLNVMVKEINDHYTKVQSQELTKAKQEIERLKEFKQMVEDYHTTFSAKEQFRAVELLKEVK